jgi:hypothetical protein
MPAKKIKQKLLRLRSIPASSQSTVHSRFRRRDLCAGRIPPAGFWKPTIAGAWIEGRELWPPSSTGQLSEQAALQEGIAGDRVSFLIEKVGEMSWTL